MKKYKVIYADPPWAYKVWSKKGAGRSAESHYPTMDIAAIKALPVGELADKDCALFLWITFPMLREAWGVMDAWGFTFKTVAFVWIKQCRKSDGLFTGIGIGLVFGCVVFALVWCKGDVLSSLFTADASVIANGYAYLKGFAPETIATAILFSMVGYFNGNDKTLWVMVQGLVQTLLVRLPMAYIMSIQPNASLTMIGLSAPTSTVVGILLNIGFFLWLKRYENQTSA